MKDRTPQEAPQAPKKRVLFVCIGNACRSQMAEGFATRYGSDAAEYASAGLSPALTIPELTRAVMLDKNISLDSQTPKGIEVFPKVHWDVVVNISGQPLPHVQADRIVEWKIQDPMGQRQVVHERVRDELEILVMRLILELRQPKRA
jgi:arsenate reductase